MACWYSSVVEKLNVTDHESLFKALKEMGEEYYTETYGEGVRVKGRGWEIALMPGQDARIEHVGANAPEWMSHFKQSYSLEVNKKTAKEKGWFVSEKKVGNNIELILRR